MRNELIRSLKEHQAAFGLDLSDDAIQRLADYYDLIREHNRILHLVGPCSPEEFAVRHILESLNILEHLPKGSKFADVGAGAGLPSIPCLLVRDDLSAVLIESRIRKAKFLSLALETLGLAGRAIVDNRQFEEADRAGSRFITCRALDKFAEKLARLIRWSGSGRMLLYGGDNLRQELQKRGVIFEERLIPLSEKRFLFILAS